MTGNLIRYKRKALKWLLLTGPASRLARNPFVRILLPTIVGAYYLILDVWGDEWWWVKGFTHQHEVAFCICLFSTLIASAYVAACEWYSVRAQTVDTRYPSILEDLVIAVSNIIGAKKSRFKYRLESLQSSTNVFEHITHPKEQIDLILKEAHSFFVKTLSLESSRFDITFMWENPATQEWEFLSTAQQNWTHTAPSKLMKSKSSAARKCVESGEIVFHPSKIFAERDKQYQPSKRDKQHGKNGSICCIPFIVKPSGEAVTQRRDRAILTFTTYGTPICEQSEEEAIAATEMLFLEFSQRVELEFILHLIKTRKRAFPVKRRVRK